MSGLEPNIIILYLALWLGDKCFYNGDLCDPYDDITIPWDRTKRSYIDDLIGLPNDELWEKQHSTEQERLRQDIRECSERDSTTSYSTRIISHHYDLVEGMKTIYNTLLSMRYLKPSDVQFPPHINPPLALQALKMAGFTNEVIEVMHELPYINSKAYVPITESFELAPYNTYSISYLNPSLNDVESARDPLATGYNDIAPEDFRLTEGMYDGTYYIYSSQDRMY